MSSERSAGGSFAISILSLVPLISLVVSMYVHDLREEETERNDCKAHGVVELVDGKAVCRYEKEVEL